jgi:hypothetical protein
VWDWWRDDAGWSGGQPRSSAVLLRPHLPRMPLRTLVDCRRGRRQEFAIWTNTPDATASSSPMQATVWRRSFGSRRVSPGSTTSHSNHSHAIHLLMSAQPLVGEVGFEQDAERILDHLDGRAAFSVDFSPPEDEDEEAAVVPIADPGLVATAVSGLVGDACKFAAEPELPRDWKKVVKRTARRTQGRWRAGENENECSGGLLPLPSDALAASRHTTHRATELLEEVPKRMRWNEQRGEILQEQRDAEQRERKEAEERLRTMSPRRSVWRSRSSS